jgi:Sap, sulfolipid-1-addressing protein
VGQVFLLALAAALNPTLVAASTLMMLLPNPKRLMLGYLLGALMTSITLGLVIVFSLEGSDVVRTTENTLSPAATMTLGGIALAAAFVVGTGRHQAAAERRRARKRDKGPPRWQRALGRGSARTTFVVGALLTLPGASYLAGLSRIDKLNYSTAETVLLVVAFNVIMLVLLEVPLLCFAIAPDWTVGTIDRAKAWIGRHARRFAVTMLTVLGALLVIKGMIELLR